MSRTCLIFKQSRNGDQYSDFIGKYYHFPEGGNANYLDIFNSLAVEFIYFEPGTEADTGTFFGYGRILRAPFPDRNSAGDYFVEISEYKPFSNPIFLTPIYKEHDLQIHTQNLREKLIIPINPESLDNLCVDGGVLLNFEADAHLVQILGEQLIESERVGILELVKNGFDAGASYCKVRIENIPSLPAISEINYQFKDYPGPVIVIEDDGKGMNRQDIQNGWLRPASTLKTDIKQRIQKERAKAIESGQEKAFESFLQILKTEHKGRVPLGEKGVGRFACHRLGKNLIIKSKTVENDFEYVLKINWDDFNNVEGEHKNLNSVGLSLIRQPLSRDYGDTDSGTQLIIYGGRQGFELDEDEIRSINRTILKLNTPNPNPKIQKTKPFSAFFECPQVKGLAEKVDFSEFEPVFTISGIVDEMGILNYDYKFNPPYHEDIPLAAITEKDQVLDLRTIVRDEDKWVEVINGTRRWRTPQCGPFFIHLDVWYRDKPWRDNLDDTFLKHLTDFGGISIFRDGINIYPAEWGAESDWLGLRQRQIKQAKRMSYYHMIGNVEIQQGVNVLLMDKTNREGMVGNRAAKDLQQLVKAVAFFMENQYMGKRDERNELTGGLTREPRALNNDAAVSSKIISNINEFYDLKKDPFKLLNDLGEPDKRKERLVKVSNSLKRLKDSLEQIEDVHDLLTEQAGFGLGIAVALHEINKTASNFYYGILELIESGEFNKTKLEELKQQSEAFEAEMSRISPLRALRNEKPKRIKISRSVRFVESMFRSRFDDLGISFTYNNEDDFDVVARFGGLNQILTNLIDNSCHWLNNPDITDKRIRIEINSKERTVIVADSGPGIPQSILPYIFQPGYSLKDPPSGLGTYICRHYMNLMNKRGEIYLAKPQDRIPTYDGAQFLLDFSNVNAE